MPIRIEFRNDTAANWTAANPILGQAEMAVQDGATPTFKIGDGVTHWNDLPYASSGSTGATGATVPTDRCCLVKNVTVPTGRFVSTAVTWTADDVASGEIIGTAFAVVDNQPLHVTSLGNFLVIVNIGWPSDASGTFRLMHVDDSGSDAFPEDVVLPPLAVAALGVGLKAVIPHTYFIANDLPSNIEINLTHDASGDQVVRVSLNAIKISTTV